ncbi:MAG: 2-polyprenyl-3-methyl-5-hydroxy-6-metoxy-1,4-benzoquinol methylase [Salibacteraceae bacterium]|jgi:2-polyprenyl-3-methyl-5-hydroxy-6-metoxy-1,4-benzoquinol methylase
MKPKLAKNKYGYVEVANKPQQEELTAYYSEKYYTDDESKLNNYQRDYSNEEIGFFKNRLARKEAILNNLFDGNLEGKSILDVGCGEGWALSYFNEKGNAVKGLEFSSSAAESINPHVAKFVMSGDVFINLENLIESQDQFDVVILDNVLEHVLDTEFLVATLKKLISDDGVLIVEVPNDFSILQQYLMDNDKIKDEFWVAYPDHLSYFNHDGLKNIFEENGWETLDITCDFPIDMHLLNDNTNYIMDSSKGKSVHFARLHWENLLDSISVEMTNELYSVYAKMGLGRNLIGYFRKK